MLKGSCVRSLFSATLFLRLLSSQPLHKLCLSQDYGRVDSRPRASTRGTDDVREGLSRGTAAQAHPSCSAVGQPDRERGRACLLSLAGFLSVFFEAVIFTFEKVKDRRGRRGSSARRGAEAVSVCVLRGYSGVGSGASKFAL